MRIVTLALALGAVPSAALAAGFEKSVQWSGRYSGVGNAAVGFVEGRESLYFNPAGLPLTENFQVVGNFSPTFSRVEAPILTPRQIASETMFSPVFALLGSWSPLPRLGVGLGVFEAGGTRAKYENVSFAALSPALTLRPDIQSNLTLIEASIGLGLEVYPGLRLGGAWRISFVNADVAQATPVVGPAGPQALLWLSFDNLNDTRFNGFRVGAQYGPPGGFWSVGAFWRSSIRFDAEQDDFDAAVQSALGGPVVALPTSKQSRAAVGVPHPTRRGRLSHAFRPRAARGGRVRRHPLLRQREH